MSTRSIRDRRLFGGDDAPLWSRRNDFDRVIDKKPQFVLWENALDGVTSLTGIVDRRGIVLGGEDKMHSQRHYILDRVRKILKLQDTEGWEDRPPDYARAIMKSFYRPSGGYVAWMMFETCRDQIRNRHTKITEDLRYDVNREKPIFFLDAAPSLQNRRRYLTLKAGVMIPSRMLRFALPDGRDQSESHLVRTEIKRSLWTPARPLQPFGASITCYCVATPGVDDTDLARGFVPSGLQCRHPSGINQATLITWFRLNSFGGLENYTIDIDPRSGELLSLRYQKADLRLAIEMDPWLDEWLSTAIRSF